MQWVTKPLRDLSDSWRFPANSPFCLDNDSAYRRWREWKLDCHPGNVNQLIVEIDDPECLTGKEHKAIEARILNCGMAIYSSARQRSSGKQTIRQVASQFGLATLDHNLCAEEDALSAITVKPGARRGTYIPYTNRSIAMHTDGYYNTLDQQVLSMLLHCVHPAAEGGVSELLDHELVYIRLRDIDPVFIQALTHPRVMTIPANQFEGEVIRPSRTGPVFLLRPDGRLHMRYTDRTRSITWKDDKQTRVAVKALKQVIHDPSPNRFNCRLSAGQGLICNNVLHGRSSFHDGDKPRLMYRARYLDSMTIKNQIYHQ